MNTKALLQRAQAELILRVGPRRPPNRLVVLAYHGIENGENFERQIDRLLQRWTPVGLDAVVEAVAGTATLPPNAVLITFDDGHRSVLEQGAPVLAARSVPAALFVVTGLLDSTRPFWWEEVAYLTGHGGQSDRFPDLEGYDLVNALKRVPNEDRLATLEELRDRTRCEPLHTPQLTTKDLLELRSLGVEIGSHSVNHPLLAQCDTQVIRAEVEDSRDHLTAAPGSAPRAFAYPSGQTDERVRAAVARSGYDIAFAFDNLVMQLLPPPDPFALSRVKTSTTAGLGLFTLRLAGSVP